MIYFNLFLSFAKIGLMMFGGGYSMLPLLEKECVEKHHWVSSDELLNYFSIGQCTPGVIAVNTATFIGTKQKGVFGGIVATLGVVFPSFVVITLLASWLSIMKDNIYFIKAFNGIRIATCALISSSVLKLSKKTITDVYAFCLAFAILILQIVFQIDSFVIVILLIILSLIVYVVREKNR